MGTMTPLDIFGVGANTPYPDYIKVTADTEVHPNKGYGVLVGDLLNINLSIDISLFKENDWFSVLVLDGVQSDSINKTITLTAAAGDFSDDLDVDGFIIDVVFNSIVSFKLINGKFKCVDASGVTADSYAVEDRLSSAESALDALNSNVEDTTELVNTSLAGINTQVDTLSDEVTSNTNNYNALATKFRYVTYTGNAANITKITTAAVANTVKTVNSFWTSMSVTPASTIVQFRIAFDVTTQFNSISDGALSVITNFIPKLASMAKVTLGVQNASYGMAVLMLGRTDVDTVPQTLYVTVGADDIMQVNTGETVASSGGINQSVYSIDFRGEITLPPPSAWN